MKPLNNYMSKKILIVGASGLVGGEILENLKTTNNELILLSRKKLLCENDVNQIVIDFENIDSLDASLKVDEIYIAIGQKLSLYELVYIKKNNRKSFVNVDYNYIKKVAEFAKNCGANSIGLISAIGANTKSFNTYLKVKGDIENEIKLMGYEKIIIAHPSHLLGKRPKEVIPLNVKIFEKITNLFGLLMIGPLQKFRNVEAKKVAKAIISKMDSVEKGIHYIDYKYFKNF